MSQRINISVPDDLYQKIQNFKERLHMSRLCQEALARAVAIEELRSQVAEDIDRLAIVFKQQREWHGQEFRKEGFEDGMKDAFEASYDSMHYIWTLSEASSPPEELFDLGASEDTREKVASGNVGSAHIAYGFDEFRSFYYAGWVAGFLDVWQRVCAKLSILEEAPHEDE